MKLSPHYLKRYKDIAVLLMRYGEPSIRSRFSSGEEPRKSGAPDPEQLPKDLERLGPTFVKLGQLLSSRPDLVPERYIKALSRLQDQVQPVPFEAVQEVVEAELGTGINKAFSEFEREPMAAASLGQVHRAALHDGRMVAVKVQRPGITTQIEQDFAALEEIASFAARHTAIGKKYQITRILEEFEKTIANELDYCREAANMIRIAENLKEFHHIQVPLPVQSYCSRRVLTMDYIDGTKITKLSPVVRLDFDGRMLAEQLFRAYLKQILVDGIFHADPHPGNVFLTRDHRIALLDLGMVGYTTPSMQDSLLKLLLAVSGGESDEAGEIAMRIGNPAGSFDPMEFRRKIGLIVAQQQNATLSQMDIGKVVLDVSKAAADTSLFVPTELTLLGKTLLQLDEVGRTLAPDFDPNESVRRNASSILNNRLKNVFTEGKLYSNLLEAKQFMGALPTRLNKILDAIGEAELNVNVRPAETEFLVDSARKVANRITTGLILAAVIIGAALLMRVPTHFQLFGYPGLAMTLFLVAAVGGLWLVLTILWTDHKSKQRERR